MRVHVVHDEAGDIQSVAVPAPEYTEVMGIVPQSGQRVSVFDQPDVADEQLQTYLRDLYQQSRVDVSGSTSKLVQK